MIDTYNISDLIRYPAAIEDFRKFGINCPDIRILEEAYVEAFDFDSGNTLYLSHHIDGNENDKAFMHLALLEFVKKYEKILMEVTPLIISPILLKHTLDLKIQIVMMSSLQYLRVRLFFNYNCA